MNNILVRSAAGLAALTTLSLAGCGQTSTPTPSSAGSSEPVTITWYASPIAGVGIRSDMIRLFEKSYPNIRVKLITAPTNTDTNRAALTTQISSGSATPDVFMGDVVWPAQFASANLALDLSKYLPSSFWSRFAPGLVQGASYRGQVYGAPFFMDAGFLYYRKDLLAEAHLPVPHTWAQLIQDSQTLQRDGLVRYGFVWEGNAYEGLTCDWMEYMTDAGGKILNAAGTRSEINSPASLKALTLMRSFITSGVSPAAVTTFEEPQAMAVFDAGQAAFLRNWDYAWSNSNDPTDSKVVGKVGVAPLPTFSAGQYPGYSNIGGWDIYINPHSQHIPQDLTFIKWITGTQAQTVLATKFSEIPTNYAVQKNPAVRQINPVLAAVSQVRLIARPAGTPAYPKVSQAIYSNINAALNGSVSPQTALQQAQAQINQAISQNSL
ncbi:carbohydrate ABC transporter substrate-binding protein, CUT1 family [Sulfobacillus acidophilus DSM 10332]|uniref:Carbohydrate ABC transporter substrate-binding protein, CUT1 family n=1 Tax=Sulfobacillus acidophilus (strain ATCC 700253 / DSM 10332 / NAL) TaxID=679936 RepID=G8TTI8_SULAD|nr:carbohydrate ABC transporter substrate-binding protein, CUT1 family [Sulfobacillus acidophilus DSM 10332]